MIFTFDKSDFCQVTAALLAGDLELAVELCVKQDRFAEALVLAIRGGPELLQTTQVIFSPQLRFHSRPNLIFSLVPGSILPAGSGLRVPPLSLPRPGGGGHTALLAQESRSCPFNKSDFYF